MLTLLARSKVDWDLIILTECWLRSVSNPPVLDGYDYYSSTNNKTQNEGIVMFVKKDIKRSHPSQTVIVY